MIELKNVKKTFGEKVLFESLNLKIENGEFVILTGESGCGKTTLLNMIGALESVDSGEIVVDKKNICITKNHMWYFREKVGFLFQNFALVEQKTVKQNLDLVMKSNRRPLTDLQALEKVGLNDVLNRRVYTLSGGEQQRVALARLMIKNCDIILADEPTGSLDYDNASRVMSILKNMNDEGKTIIMVTHDKSFMEFGTKKIAISEL